jgi:nucleoside-diphosphate kinase
MQKTLGIIKPDAVSKNLVGEIIRTAEQNGLTLVNLRMLKMTTAEARGFYKVHVGRPFFESLTRFMSEGPIVVAVFKGDEAITTWRRVMGATDPAEAAEGTLRRRFAENIERNAVHGSDSPESARFEIGYFFSEMEQME